ncbi:MAG: glucose 1-dehydrogenase [Deltaproteobacteria bacterium]|nr:glucose 1-dehydrogenase [Deltaproteobacteria bacterium]
MNRDSVLVTGKTAIVTGGGAGIGRGIALVLARFGANVAIFEKDPARVRSAGQAIEAEGANVLALEVDVREGEAVARAVEATMERFGRIDVLVNNVGGVFAAPFLETSEKGWDALHRANLKHIYHCTKNAVEHMIRGGRGGSVINVVSIEGVRAAPLYATYAAAKAGAINFTKTLALELAPHGIRVNAIAPDICLTEGLRSLMSERRLERAKLTVPLGRVGDPEDVAGVAVFLASDLSGYLTGETLHVDGGTHASAGWYHHPRDGHYVYGPLDDEEEG